MSEVNRYDCPNCGAANAQISRTHMCPLPKDSVFAQLPPVAAEALAAKLHRGPLTVTEHRIIHERTPNEHMEHSH